MELALKDRVAVVTGSATGIGQGITLALVQAGAKVAGTYNRDLPDETIRQVKEAGGDYFPIKTDMRDRESIRNLFVEAHRHYGRIDIHVNNAAVQFDKLLFEYTEEDYDALLTVNVKGYWRAIQEVAPYMKKAHYGRIINVASIHDKRPTGFDAIYGTAKGGVKMLTREAALALGPYGITVNTLSPGTVRVPPSAAKSPRPPRDSGEKILGFYNYPPGGFLSGRAGMPRDMGFLVTFIADERSAFMTGSDIRSDGGTMMN
ncbi:MAG: SDR family oxidoreductase [Treponema sp.]|jgi:glucose 1-dehydrogenase|nr:SDR family oxidoreductase [Treponema sp.]